MSSPRLVESGIPCELIVCNLNPGWVDACHWPNKHTEAINNIWMILNVCNSTSHNMQLHDISHHFSQQTSTYLGISPQQHTHLDPLVQVLPHLDQRRRCWFGTNSRATSWRSCAKLARLGASGEGTGEQPTRVGIGGRLWIKQQEDGLRQFKKFKDCWKIV